MLNVPSGPHWGQRDPPKSSVSIQKHGGQFVGAYIVTEKSATPSLGTITLPKLPSLGVGLRHLAVYVPVRRAAIVAVDTRPLVDREISVR